MIVGFAFCLLRLMLKFIKKQNDGDFHALAANDRNEIIHKKLVCVSV
jgi:hypothetical protein